MTKYSGSGSLKGAEQVHGCTVKEMGLSDHDVRIDS